MVISPNHNRAENIKIANKKVMFNRYSFAISLAILFFARSTVSSVTTQLNSEQLTSGFSTNAQMPVSNVQFGIDLYAALLRNGNVCVSPLSISRALCMAYGGACGETRAQIGRVLHFKASDGETLNDQAGLNKLPGLSLNGLEIADSFWPQITFPLLPDYVAYCQKRLKAAVIPVNYKSEREKAREAINGWVEDKTHGKISGLLKKENLDPSDRLILVNAIWFKSRWATPFPTNNNDTARFYLSSQETIAVPALEQTNNFDFAEFPNLSVLELPFADGNISLLILLPKNNDGLSELEKTLSPENYAKWTTSLQEQKVCVLLPKFEIADSSHPVEALKRLGMNDAFSRDQADFSGMTGAKDLFIADILHSTDLKIDEEGSTAASATAVMIKATGPPLQRKLIIFRVDHPFLFFIYEKRSGCILFLGRIVNPIH